MLCYNFIKKFIIIIIFFYYDYFKLLYVHIVSYYYILFQCKCYELMGVQKKSSTIVNNLFFLHNEAL